MKWYLRFLKVVYFGLIAILPVTALADYAATQGAGTTFAALTLAAKQVPEFAACDATVAAQCAAVSAAGAVKVDGSAVTQPVSGTVTANAGTNLNTSTLATSANQATNTATTVHTCAVAGYSELGCLGQIDDDVKGPIPAGTAHIGTVGTAPYPDTAVPYTSSAVNTTAAAVATLAGAASVTTYICGFSVRANATAAITGNIVVSGTISGSLNFTQWTAPLANGLGVSEQTFVPCIPASAVNTSIVVTSAAPGAGGTISTTAWGYKL